MKPHCVYSSFSTGESSSRAKSFGFLRFYTLPSSTDFFLFLPPMGCAWLFDGGVFSILIL